jgi:hypothetical protein
VLVELAEVLYWPFWTPISSRNSPSGQVWDCFQSRLTIWAIFSYRLTEYLERKAISTGTLIFPHTVES